MISARNFILESLRQHWRIHFAVGAGRCGGDRDADGALVLGISVRDSLRHLAIDRLGRIDEVIVADQFFRARLADELKAESEFTDQLDALPAILEQGSLETTGTNRKSQRCDGFDHNSPISSRKSRPMSETDRAGV